MYILYNIIGTIGAGLLLPVWLPYVLLKKKYRKSFLSRSGFISKENKEKLKQKPNIWVHAVSVGEFFLAATLIEKLRPLCPQHQFVVTVTTLTGHEVAQKKLLPEDVLLFFPTELLPVMNYVVNIVNPEIALIVETEIWPNFVYSLARKKVPLVLINGRISKKSFPRYSLVKPFMRDLFKHFAKFNMQTKRDAECIKKLGGSPGKINVAGNIKFDSAKIVDYNQPNKELQTEIGLHENIPVFLAAALEKTGREDPVAIDIFEKLKAKFPNAALIIVPRHPERGSGIANLVKSRGYEPRQRSLKEKFDDPDKQIFIVDTVGELARFYTLAKEVFVGKSIFPPGGGQNMIEPVGLGLPVIFGKYTSNFRGIADVLAENGGAKIVADENELANAVINLWQNENEAKEMVRKGQEYIRSQQGATQTNINTVLEILQI